MFSGILNMICVCVFFVQKLKRNMEVGRLPKLVEIVYTERFSI